MSLLRILHLASPALPIGAFHFSQALESAVEEKWVHDEDSALDWIGGLAENQLGALDLPVLARLHTAWSTNDLGSVNRWNAFLIASRETEELRAEDRHTGGALRKILVEIGTVQGECMTDDTSEVHCYACMFALACARWSVTLPDTLQAYAWAWTENQTLAAVKLVPLGQTAGQRILTAMVPRLASVAQAASSMQDGDIGPCAVMHGMASMRHESQYTRLFRS